MYKKKLLAVLVNFGEEQIEYLKQVISELRTFEKYQVYTIVQSNIPLEINGVDEVNVLKLNDFQLLPLSCRAELWKRRNDFDIFIYGENDHLFKETHIDNHLIYSSILPDNRISGLIQYECKNKELYFPGYHHDFDWDYKSLEQYGGKYFAHFSNVHQASFILTRDQLLKVGDKFDFLSLVTDKLSFKNKVVRKIRKKLGLSLRPIHEYSVKCKVNTDIYLYGGMKKVICISEFQDNLIHHLPNLYIDGDKGRNKFRSDNLRMREALNELFKRMN